MAINLKNNKRIGLLLIFLIIMVVVIFIILKTFHQNTNTVYGIDVGDKSDTNLKNNLYLDEESLSGVLSERISYGSNTYRETQSSKGFNVVFDLKDESYYGKNATLEVEILKGGSDLYLNSSLIFPGINNYNILREFGDSYLYIRKNISLKDNYESKSLIDYVINNYYGSKVYSLNFLNKVYPFIEDYSDSTIYLNSRFRGNLNLIVYTEKGLELEFRKIDMNSYVGKDDYKLSIRSLNNTLVYSKIIEDDGDAKTSKVPGKEQSFKVSVPDVKGVYYINFEEGKDNEYSDSSISNISINTNKIVISKNFLVITPISLYIKNDITQNVSFYYWHVDKDQVIKVKNNYKNSFEYLELNKSYQGIKYPYILEPGEHSFFINKSYLRIYNDFNFAPSKENWFEVPVFIEEQLNDPDFIVIDKERMKTKKKSLVVRYPIVIGGPKTVFQLSSSGTGVSKITDIRIVF